MTERKLDVYRLSLEVEDGILALKAQARIIHIDSTVEQIADSSWQNSEGRDTVAASTVNPDDEASEEDQEALMIHRAPVCGEGVPARTTGDQGDPPHTILALRRMAALEHRVLFQMLYKVWHGGERVRLDNIANIVAYAQMYMCLPLVAAHLREILLKQSDLWEDVRTQPLFHLGLAVTLRCPETFADALRHLIGRGVHYSQLEPAGFGEGEAAILVADLGDQLDSRAEDLKTKIDRLALTEYIPHSDREGPHFPAVTTFVSATWKPGLSTEAKAVWLAKGLFRDWFHRALSGERFWSHILQLIYHSPNDGHFNPTPCAKSARRSPKPTRPTST